MSGSDDAVAVVFGGPSAEHDVSIVSGNAIADALQEDGLAVQRIVIDLDGGWWWLPADHRRGERLPSAYDDPSGLEAQGPISAGIAIDLLRAADPRPVVFVALHGPFGEDGTIQGMLEAAGLVYTGAGVTASALGMDKAVFKRLARGLGLPVVDWREVSVQRWAAGRDAVLADLGAFAEGTGDQRLMIKPARLGSSVGMTLAHSPDEYGPALEEAFRYDTLALAERYLPAARDLEVSVVGNDPARIELYGPGEILAGHEFYDYAAKYTPGLSETSPRAEVPERTRAMIHKIARDAYRAIGAEGFARVDLLLAGDEIYLSEINTIPGFTPISLFPVMCAEGGYDFRGICRRIVELARERHTIAARPPLTPADLPR
jgi:D-alanine-D-alanine ligase